jgi:choline dehydrogenase-like flavoprotein
VMGNDAATSVTDSFGRCHELENLYVAGTGLFPSSGAVNPTFTLHALALRTAEHLFGKA